MLQSKIAPLVCPALLLSVFTVASCASTPTETAFRNGIRAATVASPITKVGAVNRGTVITRKDDGAIDSRVSTAMSIAQAPVTAAQLENAIAAASQTSDDVQAASSALRQALAAEANANAAASQAAAAAASAAKALADAQTRLDAAMLAASQISPESSAATAAAIAQAQAQAASAAAADAAARAANAEAQSAAARAAADAATQQASLISAQAAAASAAAALAQSSANNSTSAATAASNQAAAAAAQANAALSIANSLKARLSISVKDFGAKGDGVTDDTNAIQAAISAAPEYATVFFPQGDYRILAGLNLNGKRGIHLEGEDQRSTRIFCKDLTTVVFTLDGISAAPQAAPNDGITIQRLSFDGANGTGSANASSTWPGLVSSSSANGTYNFVLRDCIIQCSNKPGAIAADLRRMFFTTFDNVFIGYFPLGTGMMAGQTGLSSTTLSFNKCWFESCQVCVNVSVNVTDVNFHDTVFENSYAAFLTRNTKVALTQCYFENLGHGVASGLPLKSQGLALSALNIPIDAAITDIYSQYTFDSCSFMHHDPSGSLTAWFQGIGAGSIAGSGGSATFRECKGPSVQTLPFFKSQQQASYSYYAYDGAYSLQSIVQDVNQARLLTGGTFQLPYPAPTYSRTMSVVGGKLILGADLSHPLTSAPADSPMSGGYTPGDRADNSAPGPGLATSWVCTAAGSPGTWRATNWLPNVRTIASAVDAATNADVTIEVNYPGACLCTLPSNTFDVGKVLTYKDISGLAATNNIRFAPGPGTTLEGSPSLTANYGNINFYLSGSVWRTR